MKSYQILIFTIVLISFHCTGFAQLNMRVQGNYLTESTAQAAQLGEGVFGLQSNISSIAFSNKLEVICGSKTLLANINPILHLYGGATTRLGDGGIGVLIERLGNQDYVEMRGRIAYAHALGKQTSLGLNADIISIEVEGYEKKVIGTFGVGFQTRVYEQLLLGTTIYGSLYLGNSQPEDNYAYISMHGQFIISDNIRCYMNIQKPWHFKPQFMIGLSYHALRSLYLQAGVGLGPTLISFGAAIPFSKKKNDDFFGKLSFGVASQYSQHLGFKPSGHFIYR